MVFDSESVGRLIFPQSKIHELKLTPPLAADDRSTITNATSLVPPAVSAALTNVASWKPPVVGHDGADWVQMKSGEWLRGQMKYIQNKKVEFDSDELDQQTLDLKDVSQVYPAEPVYAQFKGMNPVYGTTIVSNNLVMVGGQEPLSLPRNQLIGITPSGG